MIYYEVVHQVVVLASNFHNPSLSYSLQPVKLGRLDPDSLWEGPPAWELGTLSSGLQPSGGAFSLFNSFIILLSRILFGRARLAARSANCWDILNQSNSLLIKDHHILFGEILLEPVETSPDNVPGFKALSSNDGIIDAGCIARHLSFFTTESIRDFYFLLCVYRAVKWHRDFFTVPINYFLFWFFYLHVYLFLDPIISQSLGPVN